MSCSSLVPFALWPAFPASDYYGTSVTFARHQAALALPIRGMPSMSVLRTLPAFTVLRWVGWCPALLLQPRLVHKRSPARGHVLLASTEHNVSGRHLSELPAHRDGPNQPGFEPLTHKGVSATGSLSLHRSTLLARPRRLAVPPFRYVVRAAPAQPGNPQVGLPSASPSRCGGQGWVSQPTRNHGASWRTVDRVEEQSEQLDLSQAPGTKRLVATELSLTFEASSSFWIRSMI
jgi:hypothetical protein